MARAHTTSKVLSLLPELSTYYLPCKAKKFLQPHLLGVRRALTILRQLLKVHGYQVLHTEHTVNNQKITSYVIRPNSRPHAGMKVTPGPIDVLLA